MGRASDRLDRDMLKVQRLNARILLRAWKRVAPPILEAEAHLEPTTEQIGRKTSAHTVKLISLQRDKSARKAPPDTVDVQELGRGGGGAWGEGVKLST